jgi:hypothetical protein
MQPELKEIRQDINEVKHSLHNIDKTLVRQQGILEEHIRRSIANERAVEILKDELKPISAHVGLFNNLAKIGVTLGSLIIGALKLWEMYK